MFAHKLTALEALRWRDFHPGEGLRDMGLVFKHLKGFPWKRDELVHQDYREQKKNQMACCGFGQRQEVPLRELVSPEVASYSS